MLNGCVPWPAQDAERYRREGYWRGEALGDVLRAAVAGNEDRVALATAEQNWTFAQDVTRRVALKHVLVAGDAGEFTTLNDLADQPRELPAPDPADVAFFLLSGGTTGMPKLIPRTHDDYAYQLRATAEALGI